MQSDDFKYAFQLTQCTKEFHVAPRLIAVPEQRNDYDCGVYVEVFASQLMRNLDGLHVFDNQLEETENQRTERWSTVDIARRRAYWRSIVQALPGPESATTPRHIVISDRGDGADEVGIRAIRHRPLFPLVQQGFLPQSAQTKASVSPTVDPNASWTPDRINSGMNEISSRQKTTTLG